jgi:hypothetical protein
MPRSSVLGQHHGLNLLQTVSCGDFIGHGDCSRVVHYEGTEKGRCTEAGGVLKKLKVHAGDHSSTRQFCFPGVLAEHWKETAPMMAPLAQTRFHCSFPEICNGD